MIVLEERKRMLDDCDKPGPLETYQEIAQDELALREQM
jgi:hypothetical protein